MLKRIFYAAAACILIILGRYLLGGDYLPFLQWWVIILGLGIIFMPVSLLLFNKFEDKGYLFSKTIGIAVTGYIMWLFASLHILKFNIISCYISLAVGILINIGILIYNGRTKQSESNSLNNNKYNVNSALKLNFNAIITQELLFFALFLIFTYIRGFKPEAYGTEKFMDYGFMTSMMRSDYMPPQDFWFSGTSLNYYYVGQYMAAFLTKLTFVKVSYAYNLMLMMTGAFAFVLPCSIVYNLMSRYCKEHQYKSRLLPALSGLIGGMGVLIAGNMHYPIYKWFIPGLQKLYTGKVTSKYWFPDATRYIGYNPPTNDKTIHEFPSYSFVLGDLHAHVINILFVVTVLGILLAWMYKRYENRDKKLTVPAEIFDPAIIAVGFFIGLFHTTNFWDFPIYFIVSGAVILFSNMVVYNFKVKALWITGLEGLVVLAAGELVCLPFTLNFDQISTTPFLVDSHTPLHQLLVLWGLPVCTVLFFLISLAFDYSKNYGKKSHKGNKLKASASKTKVKKEKALIFCFMEKLQCTDLFIITIGLCAIGLVLLPEVIYIQDIYGGDYKRANTMFKLTYQAFIMFGICFGYIYIRLIRFGRNRLQKLIAAAGLILFSMTLFYVQNAVDAWYGNIFNHAGYKGIDAAAFMKEQMPDDYLATNWLNENIKGTPVVLEANGDSYTDYERVSVITGLPTVLGWRTHEWLWKGDPNLLDLRAADIETIYTSADASAVRELIDKYDISYIYVGKLESEKYTALNNELIKSLGPIVFDSPVREDKSYETYIVRVR